MDLRTVLSLGVVVVLTLLWHSALVIWICRGKLPSGYGVLGGEGGITAIFRYAVANTGLMAALTGIAHLPPVFRLCFKGGNAFGTSLAMTSSPIAWRLGLLALLVIVLLPLLAAILDVVFNPTIRRIGFIEFGRGATIFNWYWQLNMFTFLWSAVPTIVAALFLRFCKPCTLAGALVMVVFLATGWAFWLRFSRLSNSALDRIIERCRARFGVRQAQEK